MKRMCILTVVVLIGLTTARASFAKPPQKDPLIDIINQNPVVVTGEIVRTQKGPGAYKTKEIKYKFDVAFIKIEQVIKNILEDRDLKPGDEIPLGIPTNRILKFIYKEGQNGVWILDYRGKLFWATLKEDFQPLSKLKDVTAIFDNINKNKASIANYNNQFGLDIYKNIIAKSPGAKNENLVLSPFSISSAFAVAWAGARKATENQISHVMNFNLEQDDFHVAFGDLLKQINRDAADSNTYKLGVHNSLWVQEGSNLQEDVYDITTLNYFYLFYEVNFRDFPEEATRSINEWAESKTYGKIKNLIKSGLINKLTRMVLTNAVYFKGNWAEQFKKNLTTDAPFKIAPDKNVSVPMMYQKSKFKYAQNDELQILELPYESNDLSMILLLPNKTQGLENIEKNLDVRNLNSWLDELKRQEVKVYVPRFKIFGSFSLAKILAEMGMPDAFTGKADFSGFYGTKDLFISNVVQKAFIEVNEQGTEAAAATAVIMETTMAPTKTTVFRADHPFIFIIRHNQTKSILFIGKVINPQMK
jgi:serpin B